MVKKSKLSPKNNDNNNDRSKDQDKEAIAQWVVKLLDKNVEQLSYDTKYSLGLLKRTTIINTLKYTILPNMTHGNTIVFKLFDLSTKKEINYALLFCEQYSKSSQILEREQIGKFTISYYSVAPCLISCDGEYRGGFNKYKLFRRVKILYPEIWDTIETYVIKISRIRQWSIYPRYFHSESIDDNYELERIIKTDNVMMDMLCLTWFNFVYNEFKHENETHMNETFKEIFITHIKDDTNFLKSLILKFSDEKIIKMVNMIRNIKIGLHDTNLSIRMGIKMIPLNNREIQEPFKLKYKPWREYLINVRCADLIINQIAPGVSLTSDLFIIQNSNKGLFDNKSQHDRLKNSELATDISKLLKDAHRNTYFATNLLSAEVNNDNKKWINTKFKKLANKIQDPINYTEEEIIMSDVSIAYPSEYVGKTFSDILQTHSNLELLGNPIKNHEVFAKYLFEICYTLLCLNEHLGVIHGDFHLNNATIGQLYSGSSGNIMYCINDIKYVFENKGIFACVIDFSRSLLNPEKYNILFDKSMPKNFRLINDYEIFETNESINLLNVYLQLFPAKQKKKQELALLFKVQFQAVFKLLTCIDVYMFSYRLIALMSQNAKVHKNTLALLEKIFKLAESFITEEMNHLAADESYGKKILEDPYPIEQIIKKCFPEYLENPKAKYIITDYYNYNNKFINSLDTYDTFPTFIKNKFRGDEQKDKDRKEIRHSYEKEKKLQMEHIKFLAQKNINNDNY